MELKPWFGLELYPWFPYWLYPWLGGTYGPLFGLLKLPCWGTGLLNEFPKPWGGGGGLFCRSGYVEMFG